MFLQSSKMLTKHEKKSHKQAFQNQLFSRVYMYPHVRLILHW